MAMNRPVTSSGRVSPVTVSRRVMPVEPVVAVDGRDLGVPHHLDLGVREGALLHDLGGAELLAAVDQVTFEANRVRKVASSTAESPPPTTAMCLVAEEEAVAGRAPGHAAAGELVLARQAQLPVARAHGQDTERAVWVPWRS